MRSSTVTALPGMCEEGTQQVMARTENVPHAQRRPAPSPTVVLLPSPKIWFSPLFNSRYHNYGVPWKMCTKIGKKVLDCGRLQERFSTCPQGAQSLSVHSHGRHLLTLPPPTSVQAVFHVPFVNRFILKAKIQLTVSY